MRKKKSTKDTAPKTRWSLDNRVSRVKQQPMQDLKKKGPFHKQRDQKENGMGISEDDTAESTLLYCLPCEIAFTSEVHFDLHLKYKHSRTPLDESADEQGKKAIELPEISNKEKIELLAHKENLSVSCTICKKKLASKHSLQNHMNIHEGIRPFACTICPATFYDKGSLARHIKTHSDKKEYVCEFCSKAYKGKAGLLQHRLSHTGVRPFACELCPKQFFQKAHLNKHILCIHDKKKREICKFCLKAFHTIPQLQLHIRTHTNERPFKCKTCGKSFADSSNLKKHERQHSGDYPYVCIECGKQFISSTDLKRHLVSHINMKRYNCNVCDFTSKSEVLMKCHIDTHFGDHGDGVTFDGKDSKENLDVATSKGVKEKKLKGKHKKKNCKTLQSQK